MYGIIHDSIFDSSLRDSWQALITFMALITLADSDDNVDMTLNALAGRTGLPLGVLDEGIKILEKSDPQSRSHAEDGRRIVRLEEHRPWGWHVVNRHRYKRMRSQDERREYMRNLMREKRLHSVSNELARVSLGRREEGGGRREKIKDKDRQLSALPSGAGRRAISRKSLENGEALPEGEITADQAFDEIFYPEYPRKRDRQDAFKAWKSLKLKDDDEETIRRIMLALRRDIREEWRDRSLDKIPYPAHWLRMKGWMD